MTDFCEHVLDPDNVCMVMVELQDLCSLNLIEGLRPIYVYLNYVLCKTEPYMTYDLVDDVQSDDDGYCDGHRDLCDCHHFHTLTLVMGDEHRNLCDEHRIFAMSTGDECGFLC